MGPLAQTSVNISCGFLIYPLMRCMTHTHRGKGCTQCTHTGTKRSEVRVHMYSRLKFSMLSLHSTCCQFIYSGIVCLDFTLYRGREGGREGGSEGGREGEGREGRREEGREGGREGEREVERKTSLRTSTSGTSH